MVYWLAWDDEKDPPSDTDGEEPQISPTVLAIDPPLHGMGDIWTDCFCLVIDEFANPISPFLVGHQPPHPKHPNPGWKTDAKSCVRSLKFWMDGCLRDHEKCRRFISKTFNPPLPTRVIKITDSLVSGGHPTVRLVESKGVNADYICLSHCWGSLRPSCLTTRETYNRNMVEIPWDSLPLTFQQAIIITRLLGKDFIWIDSICIIQNDEVNWRAEAGGPRQETCAPSMRVPG